MLFTTSYTKLIVLYMKKCILLPLCYFQCFHAGKPVLAQENTLLLIF